MMTVLPNVSVNGSFVPEINLVLHLQMSTNLASIVVQNMATQFTDVNLRSGDVCVLIHIIQNDSFCESKFQIPILQSN